MGDLKLLKPTNDLYWKTTTFSGCNEHDEEIPYLKVSFPEGTGTLHKVDALADAIKIIIQSDPSFSGS